MQKQYRALAIPPTITETDGGPKRLTGYALKFNTVSNDMGFLERLLPGAVTINPDTYCTFNHEECQLLGRLGAGLTLTLDDVGLLVDCQLPNTTVANDVWELVNKNIVRGMSFGFIPSRVTQTTEGDTTILDVQEFEVFEVSCVVNPAYPDTSLMARSMQELSAPVIPVEPEPQPDMQLLTKLQEQRQRIVTVQKIYLGNMRHYAHK